MFSSARVPAALVAVLAVVLSVTAGVPAGADDADRYARKGPTLSGYDRISAGGEYTCGTIGGSLFCWGRNTWGQVGTGERTESVDEPTRVGDRTSWRRVAAGGATTCGIRGDAGRLYCWGLNNRGQVGDGTREVRVNPRRVPGRDWRAVDVGWYHACGIREGGALYCWGDNQYGELGQGDTRQDLRLHRVRGRWYAVRTDGWTTCGIKHDRSLWCWGRNLLGQVGDGSWADRTRPVRIGGDARWSQVEMSWTSACARRGDGSVHCWGRNDRGGVGDGTRDARNRPTAVLGGHDASRISVFEGGACLLDTRGRTHCWGDNRYHQVGGSQGSYTRPRQRPGTYRELSSGWLHTCGLRDAAAVCWGSNERSQLGRATTYVRPTRADGPLPGRRAAALSFRIATFNALGEHHSGPYRDADRFGPSRLRAEWMVQAIVNQKLDVIGVQEASGGQVEAILRAGDGRLASFPDPAVDPQHTESTLVWNKSRFEAVKKKVIRTMFISRELPRPYVKLRDRATGREFWVMAIHNAGWDMQHKRNVAVREQIAKIKQLEESGLPVYYIGDFNEKRTIFCKVRTRTGLEAAHGGRITKDGECRPPGLMRVDWLFGSRRTDWSSFQFSKAPMVRLTTDHWVPMASVRVP